MPLPVRAPSALTANSDSQKHSSRTNQPKQSVLIRKPKTENTSKEENGIGTEDMSSSVFSAKTSGDASQASSRIPSPTKRNSPSHSSKANPSNTNRDRPLLKSHVRQRSTVISTPNARQALGHSRSISAVSIHTTSTSSSDQPKTIIKPPLSHKAQNVSSPTKLRPVTQNRMMTSTGLDIGTHPSSNIVHIERMQNELYQLSIVHRDSSKSLPVYHSSIAEAISIKTAELSVIQRCTRDKSQAFSLALNLRAVDSWLQQSGHRRTCQSMQNLSIALRDLSNLVQIFEGEDGLAATFGDWYRSMISHNHTSRTNLLDEFVFMHMAFEESIRPELQRFKQQLTAATATFSNLPGTISGSSLARVIQSHFALARTLELQCQIMLQIGEKLVAEHRRWIELEVSAALNEMSRSHDGGRQMDPLIWDS